MDHWYLVHTKPNRERQVAVQLHQRGFLVYLPLIWASPVNPRATRVRPYFPGHLFVKLDLQSVAVDVIRWAPGVRGLVEFYGGPASISEAFVVELQQCLNRVSADGGNGLDGARHTDFFTASPRPFEGYEGILNTQLLGADRARILLACVQQEAWRQYSQSRPAAGASDGSATPPLSR